MPSKTLIRAYRESEPERKRLRKNLKPCPFCGKKPKLDSPVALETSRSAIMSTVSCSCIDMGSYWPWDKQTGECLPRIVQDRMICERWNRRKLGFWEERIISTAIKWHLELEKEGTSLLGGKIEYAVARYLKLKAKK